MTEPWQMETMRTWDEIDEVMFIRTVEGETLITMFEYLKVAWALLVTDRERWFWHQSLILWLWSRE